MKSNIVHVAILHGPNTKLIAILLVLAAHEIDKYSIMYKIETINILLLLLKECY